MKIKRKALVLLLAGLLITIGTQVKILAGGIWASASGNVQIGQSFTVTVGSSGMMVDGLTVSCSGCTITSGLGRTTLDTGESMSVTAVLNSPSGATVSFYGNGADYATETEGPVSTSASISAYVPPASNNNNGSSGNSGTTTPNTPNKQAPSTDTESAKLSANNNLSGLSVSEGTLTPEFNADVTSYQVNVASTTNEITLNATAADAKASITGIGKINLKAGENTTNIVVKAENGSEKTYSINIVVDEKPLVYIKYNGNKLGVVRNLKDVTIPEGFSETKIKIDGKEIVAWKNEKINKTIVYLSDKKNNKNFYLYENNKITSSFTYCEIANNKLYLLDVPEKDQKIEGMIYQEIKINELKTMGWIFKDNAMKNFKLIYAMDMNGTTRLYQYESEDKVLQRFSGVASMTQKELEEKLNKVNSQKTIWMVTGISGMVIALGSIGFIFYTLKRKK